MKHDDWIPFRAKLERFLIVCAAVLGVLALLLVLLAIITGP